MRVYIEIPEDESFHKDPRAALRDVFNGLAEKATNGTIRIPLNEAELRLDARGVELPKGTAAQALAHYVCS